MAWESFGGNRTLGKGELEMYENILVRDESFDKKGLPRMYLDEFYRNCREGKRREELKKPASKKEENVKPEDVARLVEEYKKIDFASFMCKSIEILGKKNAEARSWKEKLELVDYILQNSELENKELAAIGGYLQLINNGQIRCEENGTHFRPNHHANIALGLYTLLIGRINKENSFLVKTILKNLPSFSSKFRSDVPLTRIRDIAHRGDIPHVM